jgi:hypothetical protein
VGLSRHEQEHRGCCNTHHLHHILYRRAHTSTDVVVAVTVEQSAYIMPKVFETTQECTREGSSELSLHVFE